MGVPDFDEPTGERERGVCLEPSIGVVNQVGAVNGMPVVSRTQVAIRRERMRSSTSLDVAACRAMIRWA